MDLRRTVDLLARRAALVAIAVVAAVAAAYGGWQLLPTTYTAAALLHVPTSPTDRDWRQYDLDFADRLMNTYANLAASHRVATEVARRLGRSEAPDGLGLELVANTELMRAVARGPTPLTAADAANALADVLIELGGELAAAPDLAGGPPVPRVVETATPPAAPRGPSLGLLLALAGVAGLVAGVLLAFVAENVDPRVFDVDRIAELTGLPVLAVVPRFTPRRPVGVAEVRTPAARSYRRLRTRLIAGHGGSLPRVVLVVGGEAGDGASTTVANLAKALADAGRAVVVFDGDPNRGVQHELLGAAPRPRGASRSARGLLGGKTALATAVDGVRLVRARPRDVAAFLTELEGRATTVLVDVRPLTESGDALVVAEHADAVLIAVRRGRSVADALVDAREELRSVNARAVGVVVTHAHPSRRASRDTAAIDEEEPAETARSRLEEPADPAPEAVRA